MTNILDCEKHLAAFVRSFVIAARKDRWLGLLSRRGKNTFGNSAKLMQALDSRFCEQVNGRWSIDGKLPCVFYDFYNDPVVIDFEEAAMKGQDTDAIASIESGQLAIHWSHEGWSWLCRK